MADKFMIMFYLRNKFIGGGGGKYVPPVDQQINRTISMNNFRNC